MRATLSVTYGATSPIGRGKEGFFGKIRESPLRCVLCIIYPVSSTKKFKSFNKVFTFVSFYVTIIYTWVVVGFCPKSKV